jgi:hypothetical protein
LQNVFELTMLSRNRDEGHIRQRIWNILAIEIGKLDGDFLERIHKRIREIGATLLSEKTELYRISFRLRILTAAFQNFP